MKMKILTLLVAGALILPSCSLLQSSEPAPVIYTLQPSAERQAASPSSNAGAPVVVVVPKPLLPAGYETDQIALLLDNGRRLDYYSGARWAAALDDLIQENIVTSAHAKLPNQIVDTSDLSIPADYRLATTFSNFQPVYGASATSNPRLDIEMIVTLIALPEENVVRYFTLKQSVQAPNNNLTSITAALSMQLETMLSEALTRIQPDLVKHPVVQ